MKSSSALFLLRERLRFLRPLLLETEFERDRLDSAERLDLFEVLQLLRPEALLLLLFEGLRLTFFELLLPDKFFELLRFEIDFRLLLRFFFFGSKLSR